MFGCFCCALSEDSSHNEILANTEKETQFSGRLPSQLSALSAQNSSRWTATANSTTHLYPNSKSSKDDESSQTSCSFVIENRFEVMNPIGQGSFGTVYHGKDTQNDKFVAIKILKQKGHQSYYRETNVLKHLNGLVGVPQIMWKGRIGNRDILIVDRLGCDLSMLFEYCGHQFSVQTTLKLGIEMMKLIQSVHSKGILHRDVKPHNFLIGYKQQKDKIFIIDFGLAKSYISSTDKMHKKQASGLMPVGTARYASIWTHKGVSQSRRDDLESIGFVLIYFLQTKLPWQGLKINTKHEKWKKICNVKVATQLDNLCRGIPMQFKKYLEYVRNLKFTQKPNYQHLIDLFQEAADQNDIDLTDVVWDWDKVKK